MKPLYAIAFGLILVAVGPTDAEPGTFDPFPDPLGWIFILIGLHGLADCLDDRRFTVLRFLGAAALVISAALVVPAAAHWVAADASLGWAADIPRFAFLAILSYELSASALRHRAAVAAACFNLAALALLFVLAAPPVAFGGDVEAVGTAGEATAQATQLVLIVLSLVFGAREWAGAREPAGNADDDADEAERG